MAIIVSLAVLNTTNSLPKVDVLMALVMLFAYPWNWPALYKPCMQMLPVWFATTNMCNSIGFLKGYCILSSEYSLSCEYNNDQFGWRWDDVTGTGSIGSKVFHTLSCLLKWAKMWSVASRCPIHCRAKCCESSTTSVYLSICPSPRSMPKLHLDSGSKMHGW